MAVEWRGESEWGGAAPSENFEFVSFEVVGHLKYPLVLPEGNAQETGRLGKPGIESQNEVISIKIYG